MQLEFNTSHLLFISVLLCLVCLCRQVTDIGSSIVSILDKCECSCVLFEGGTQQSSRARP